MAADKEVVDRCTEHLKESARVAGEELESIIANVRWIVTLVLAEIAGLAGYRQLLGEKDLSIWFAVAVVGLAITLIVFVVAVIHARSQKALILSSVQCQISQFSEIFHDSGSTPDEGDQKIRGRLAKCVADFQKWVESNKGFEALGLIAFGLVTSYVTVILFITEFGRVFFPQG